MIGINVENPTYEILKQLKEKDRYVRFSYHGDKVSSYIGKINELTKRDILLLPYIVWENIPTPKMDQFLNRCRLEKEIAKPISLINLIPEPLSEGYAEYLIKWTNYFSSRLIKDEKIRENLFDRKTYLLPTKEEIEAVEQEIKESNNSKQSR